MKKSEDSSRSEHMVKMAKVALQDIPAQMNPYDVAASGQSRFSLRCEVS